MNKLQVTKLANMLNTTDADGNVQLQATVN